MALQQWETYLLDAGIPAEAATVYAKSFVDNRITLELLPTIDRAFLRDLGINIIGDIMKILHHAKTGTPDSTTSINTTLISTTGPTASHKSARLPTIASDMTHPQFRKFKIDWAVYKQIAGVPEGQITSMIYNACDDATQTSVINTYPNFLAFTETDLLNAIETIVTKKSNPTVHRMQFASLLQHENELLKDYVVRLKSSAQDCEFSCPHCEHDISKTYIRDQFIRGLSNEVLQVDILAKATTLKGLEDVVKHAEAFETALHDHARLQDASDAMAVRSQYKQQKSSIKQNPCSGCGSLSHTSKERSQKCPAWGKTCNNCKLPNHFIKVCRKPKTETVEALLANVTYDKVNNVYKAAEVTEIFATLTPDIKSNKTTQKPTSMKVFPDSGASICLAGPQHLDKLGVKQNSLTQCNKLVRAVGGSVLRCSGWLPMTFTIEGHNTTQPLYICDKVDRVYISRKGCTELSILPETFPFPMTNAISSAFSVNDPVNNLPSRPATLPFEPTEENVPKLKQYLLDQFSQTTFNRDGPFPSMDTKPAHIHLKADATPHARHNPIPVPFHLKETIKKSLDDDVKRGIITPVPIGTPVEWCTTMVTATKKNGSIRRTVDLQQLNAQSKRETHHCPSPFQLACQVPSNTKKTVFDAVDGYHAIPLDEESQHLTTFITEWGRYMYLRMPQGFVASGDAYTSRYDDIIKDIPRKVKCVDDTLLYDSNITDSFFHAWDYLQLCGEKGIVLNPEKFQFCQDTAQFAGLQITPTGIAPSESMLNAIKNFPAPKNITDARSWFGLVNQVAWAYSISPIMLPFRELVKHKSKFYWDDTLERLFNESKQLLISAVEEGIRSFDYNRTTCLQTDWSKDGYGYLLLQQHCQCATANAPICCPDGWKLIYAGSTFTSESQSHYGPTEGEALAVAWSLDHAKMFVLGCKNLIITTDQQPLLGIFNDRDLSTIKNPRLQKLKSHTLRFRFTIQYCPGKWMRGPDAMSRNPANVASIDSFQETMKILRQSTTIVDETFQPETNIEVNAICAINMCQTADNIQLVTLTQVRQHASGDGEYQSLLQTIRKGFPSNRNDLPASLRPFWEVRDRLSQWDDIVMLDKRLVIPKDLRHQLLQSLHSAHQGCTGMQARANSCIYWPGINKDIHRIRDNCRTCVSHSPSQPKEPIIHSPPPQYPFQMVTGDYFIIASHHYMTIIDKYSGWNCLYHFGTSEATSSTLISTCRTIFTNYGVPEEFSSDGGPQLTANKFQQFLSDWGVKHRLSSAEYPQSNGRAELGVKTAKRILYENLSPNGTIDNDKVARAILQYRNTPLPDLKLSPAQILFHRQLRDHIPTHPSHYQLHSSWIIDAKQREEAFHKRNHVITENYNHHSTTLPPLSVGTTVVIQNRGKKYPRQWLRSGIIVETLPNRQYRIKTNGSGRITLQNRRFIKPASLVTPPTLISPTTSPTNLPLAPPAMQPTVIPPTDAPEIAPEQAQVPIVRPTSNILRRLASHNAPGLLEQQPLLPRR